MIIKSYGRSIIPPKPSRTILILRHSAKGSTWEDHKYIKRVDGTYYYPSGYEGGRTIDSLKDGGKDESEKKETSGASGLNKDDIENLANEVIKGNFGNGQMRKDLLGEAYQEVQNRVNELMRGKTGSTKISDVSKTLSDNVEKVVNKSSGSTNKSIDLSSVYSVYDRQSNRASRNSEKEKGVKYKKK